MEEVEFTMKTQILELPASVPAAATEEGDLAEALRA
jgi:hypothetical protein